MKKALVCGAGGFIGSHLMKRLKEEEYYVVGADLKYPEHWDACVMYSDDFIICDLTERFWFNTIFTNYGAFDEIYQLAADMGGAGYIFSGAHDAQVMMNSGLINLNLCKSLASDSKLLKTKVFYSSSACVYPQGNQTETDRPVTTEFTAYPANPDSEYGWEKLFSERLYFSMHRNYGLNVRVARFHNIFGPYGAYNNGREKAPAAMCRKVAELPISGGTVEVWGDGEQTRSFLYIDECLDGVRRFMHSDFSGPLNIGSAEMVSINDLVKMISMVATKNVNIKHIAGPLGVRGRNSDNRLIQEKLGWSPSRPLLSGISQTYDWIDGKVNNGQKIKKKRVGSQNN